MSRGFPPLPPSASTACSGTALIFLLIYVVCWLYHRLFPVQLTAYSNCFRKIYCDQITKDDMHVTCATHRTRTMYRDCLGGVGVDGRTILKYEI
jgi:hypothetical protein